MDKICLHLFVLRGACFASFPSPPHFGGEGKYWVTDLVTPCGEGEQQSVYSLMQQHRERGLRPLGWNPGVEANAWNLDPRLRGGDEKFAVLTEKLKS